MALWLFRDQDENKDKVIVEGETLAIESEKNFERLNAVERISIINAGESWRLPLCPNLITLCIRKNINQYSNLQFMSKLKVLDLSRIRIEHLPSEIGKLINLEFLNLSMTSIQKRFPTDLKNLENLRVLLMEKVGFDLQIIPLEVIEKVVKEDSGTDREDAGSHIFSNLTHLALYFLPKLESIGFSFPKIHLSRLLPIAEEASFEFQLCQGHIDYNRRTSCLVEQFRVGRQSPQRPIPIKMSFLNIDFFVTKNVGVTWQHVHPVLSLNSNSAKHTLIAIQGNQHWWNNSEVIRPNLKDQFQSNFKSDHDLGFLR
ncbi:uncharacterized protein LOC113859905 [Abrus precatorius]|uniref:Uncharacterized protein LOC113859905 n=1 Tax=Abrus precatorius TaxID=3816 RepID=A0A8B8KYD1_ABRPR|nr:uncharacterized protein LOC113859905 [Abrus precatorius]